MAQQTTRWWNQRECGEVRATDHNMQESWRLQWRTIERMQETGRTGEAERMRETDNERDVRLKELEE